MTDTTGPLHGKAADRLPSPVRELLAAIEAALTVPIPATDEPHDAGWRLLENRASYVCASLRGLLADEDPEPAFDADFIRKRTAALPATYKAYVAPEDRPAGTGAGR